MATVSHQINGKKMFITTNIMRMGLMKKDNGNNGFAVCCAEIVILLAILGASALSP